ncbi:MAG: hypothetical protein Q4A61_02765 [Porphyromonadaceae bacterium]|nr:hypothetical protein [Porphyromonadaceae bacterium]
MKLNLERGLTSRNRSSKSVSGDKRRRRSSQTLTFVFFVALAFFFWVLQRMQSDVVRTLYIPLVVDSLCIHNQPIDSLPRFVEVEVLDKGFEHIRYTLDDLEPIHLGAIRDPHRGLCIGIDRRELAAALTQRLSPSAVILRQSVQELSIGLRARGRKRLPLQLEAVPIAALGFTTSSVSIEPDSITVYGDKSELQALGAILLPNIYNDIKSSFEGIVSLKLAEGLQSDIRQVRLSIEVEELTEQSFTLPIAIHGIPEGYRLMPLPSVATVLLTIPRSRYADLSEVDIELSATYTPAEDWERGQRASDRTLPVMISKAPEWIKRYSIKPERIQFVLEK